MAKRTLLKKRKTLSNKIRFKVFKPDFLTCQSYQCVASGFSEYSLDK